MDGRVSRAGNQRGARSVPCPPLRAPGVVLAVALLAVVGPHAPATARAAEGSPAPGGARKPADPVRPERARPGTDAEAAAALAAVDAAREDPAARLAALRRAGAIDHVSVADRLFREATGREASAWREEAFHLLALQTGSAGRFAPRVAAFLAAEAEALRKAASKGDHGFIIDRATGDPVTDTPEGRAAIEAKRARGLLLAAAVRAARGLGSKGEPLDDALRTFLQSGSDELVVEAMGIFGARQDWSVLPDLLRLFEMYPRENRWETGAVADLGGTNASAKARWMGIYGDPDKRRPRPVVVRALRRTVEEITGEKCADPDALRALLDREDVKKRLRSPKRG